ncbi:conserved hypothetical protein [Anaeromyxobacter sp. K]|uniref:hypothetical protein n=1 Tax=Anaeromyxobacter sp. (strain K) TaxID=447217 RepID=UPI00015F9243|nr:hypothetical protein [Anaeromyxobacter sp. K]ACG75115.1 conserved hypothetical protein [Anaeromyxobacter sp. K]
MRLDARRTGEAIAAARGELARIWRSARATAADGRRAPAAALDGVVEAFVGAVGDALARGAPPEEAWERTTGLVRLEAEPDGGTAEAEWRLLGEVLSSACETLEADADATDRVAQAVDAGRRGIEALRAGRRKPGVAVAWRVGRVRR